MWVIVNLIEVESVVLFKFCQNWICGRFSKLNNGFGQACSAGNLFASNFFATGFLNLATGSREPVETDWTAPLSLLNVPFIVF